VADEEGLRSLKLENYPRLSYCIFEFVYFSRPDSKIFGEFVDKTRRKLGKNLALEKPADADIVIAVPDSSNTAALGYSSRSNIKFEIGLIRNHYIGRTFINPSQSLRDLGVKIKFNPVGGVLKGRRVVVVEDSIVRGTTLQKLTKLLRKAGAKEVHVRVSSPPIKYPCFYGLDFPTREELIANKMSVPQIKEFLEVNSLEYLSIDGLLSSVSCGQENFCTACFSGDYPVPVTETADKSVFEALKLD
jgi:amidophosphoribosyltransferase